MGHAGQWGRPVPLPIVSTSSAKGPGPRPTCLSKRSSTVVVLGHAMVGMMGECGSMRIMLASQMKHATTTRPRTKVSLCVNGMGHIWVFLCMQIPKVSLCVNGVDADIQGIIVC